jgi:hypothetical protein
VKGLAAATAATKRLLHSAMAAVGETDPAGDVALVLEAVTAHVTNTLHLQQEAERHLHEAEDARRRIGERLPTVVLEARSRRPGRR